MAEELHSQYHVYKKHYIRDEAKWALLDELLTTNSPDLLEIAQYPTQWQVKLVAYLEITTNEIQTILLNAGKKNPNNPALQERIELLNTWVEKQELGTNTYGKLLNCCLHGRDNTTAAKICELLAKKKMTRKSEEVQPDHPGTKKSQSTGESKGTQRTESNTDPGMATDKKSQAGQVPKSHGSTTGRLEADDSQEIPKSSDSATECKSDRNPGSELLNMTSQIYPMIAEELLNLALIHQKFTGKGIKLAIIDGGFNFEHESLRPLFGSPAVRSLTDGSFGILPEGRDHGTSVTGIAAGKPFVSNIQQSNGQFYTYPGGIAPNVELTLCTFNGTLEGLKAIFLKLEEDGNFNDVVSLSWGKDRTKVSEDFMDEFLDIVDRLEGKGTTIFAASGNSGNSQTVTFPACLRKVVSVGSHTKFGRTAEYSREEGNDVDICVYGEAIAPSGPPNKLSDMTGTSMATPVAAAVTCLALECARQPSINGEKYVKGKEGKVVLLKAMKNRDGVLKPGSFFLKHNEFLPDKELRLKFREL